MIRGELGRSVDRSIGEKEEELWLHLARRLIDSYTVIPDTEMDVVERKEKGGRTKLRTKKAKREGGKRDREEIMVSPSGVKTGNGRVVLGSALNHRYCRVIGEEIASKARREKSVRGISEARG